MLNMLSSLNKYIIFIIIIIIIIIIILLGSTILYIYLKPLETQLIYLLVFLNYCNVSSIFFFFFGLNQLAFFTITCLQKLPQMHTHA